MPYKKRSQEEVDAILKELETGSSRWEVCQKYDLSESSLTRIINVSRGLEAEPSKRKAESKIKKLEDTLKERDREIALLKAALKKS
ncbi:MAG: transposase [Bdellovibrio sp.]|nr:transposase [Bdellovibrio sp.]